MRPMSCLRVMLVGKLSIEANLVRSLCGAVFIDVRFVTYFCRVSGIGFGLIWIERSRYSALFVDPNEVPCVGLTLRNCFG